jgi:two-component system OmpR family sensor kinase
MARPTLLSGAGSRTQWNRTQKEARPMASEQSLRTSQPDRLLLTLQHLLGLSAANVTETMQQVAQRVTQALGADKLDVFVYNPDSKSLIAVETSETPMGRQEKAIGLDRLPVDQGGRVAEVYRSGQPYWSGQVQQDAQELAGFREQLRVQSEMIVPFSIEPMRRGVLLVCSSRPDFFTEHDLRFLEAVSNWVGVVLHRAELSEQYTREQTEQARRLAAEEILTVMAHDLHNYLTPIKLRLDLLERRMSREGQETYAHELEIVNRGVRRLSRLVTDLLDAERLRQGLFSLHRQVIDLVEVVKEAVFIWSTSERSFQVQTPDRLLLTADRERLQQAIENLLANAVTHSELHTEVQVLVAQEQHVDGVWATVTISNQGEALSPEQLSSLFQPYVKGTRSPGLGVGLWLAQQIAQAHQGTLTAQTEGGTTVRFTLSLPVEINQPE